MAVPAYQSMGTVGTGTTTVVPGLPASLATGDGCLILVVTKPDTATIVTPSGWTLVANVSGGGGTTGNSTGPSQQAWFFREKDATWSTMPTVTVTNGTRCASAAFRYTKTAGTVWDITAATGAWGTAATTTNMQTTLGSDPGLTANDAVIGCFTNQSGGGGTIYTSESWTATGVSAWGTVTERSELVQNSTNPVVGSVVFTGSVTTGTSSAAPVMNGTTTGSAGRGTSATVRLREAVATTPISGTEAPAVSVAETSAIASSSSSTDTAAITISETSSVTVIVSGSDGAAITATEGPGSGGSGANGVVTKRDLTGSTANQNTYTSNSFTPVAGEVLFVIVHSTGAVNTDQTLSASANSLTFTRKDTLVHTLSGNVSAVFVSDQFVPSSPSAMTVTFDSTTDQPTGAFIEVLGIAGCTSAGTGAIRQAALSPNLGANAAYTATFASATLTTNAIVGFVGYAGALTITQPSGFTEIDEPVDQATPPQGFEVASLNSGQTNTAYTWTASGATVRANVGAWEFNTTGSGVAGQVDIITTISGSESTAITITESNTLAGSSTSTDTSAITIAETSAVAGSSTSTDTSAITIAETKTLAGSSTSTDTSAITISETSSVVVTLSTTDTAAITISDTDTITGTPTYSQLWHLDEASGNPVEAYSSTAGAVAGAGSLVYQHSALQSGSTFAIETTASSSMSLPVIGTAGKQGTVAFTWASTAGTAGGSGIIWRDNTSAAGAGWFIGMSGSFITLRINGFNRTTGTAPTAYLDGNPHRILLTTTGTQVTLWIDAVQIDTFATTQNFSTINTPVWLGRNGTNVTQFSPGVYDEYGSQYGTAFTQTEVDADYAANTPVTIKSATDTSAITISDSSSLSIFNAISGSESVAVTIADVSSSAISSNRTDTAAVTIAETKSLDASSTSTDTSAITISESSSVAIITFISATDTASISIAESNTLAASSTSTDTAAVSVAETAAIASTTTTTDTTAVTITETSGIGATQPGTDTAAIGIVDTSSVLVLISTTDTSAISIADASSLNIPVSATDTSAITIAETRTVSSSSTSTDTAAISVSETATVNVSVSTTDTSAISVAETASAGIFNAISTTDTAAISIAEGTSTIANTLSTTDTSAITIAETTSSFRTIPTSDTTAITVTETAGISAGLPGQETIAVGVVDTSSVFVTVSATDGAAVSVSETTTTLRPLSASDTTAISIGDSGSVNAATAGTVLYVYTSGVWKVALFYVYHNGAWRETTINYFNGTSWVS